MLNELDPYTNYYAIDDAEDYLFQSTGKYGGVGCVPINSGEFIAIDEVFENGPGEKGGLKVGDVIIAIDGKSIKNIKDDAVSKLIKGAPGTVVKFTTKNPFNAKEEIKTITREEISLKNIPFSALIGPNKNIAYVRLTQFVDRSSNNVKSTLDSLQRINPNMAGVILDLRGNPGGLLDEAINMCNLFMPKNQLVVNTKGKVKEMQKEYKTTSTAWSETMPVAVLINKSSASASEIVSGTLQDVDRAVVVGQKSFGKGLVQTTRKLPYNTQVKITTAKYYTPSGRCIQALDYSNRNDDGTIGEMPDSLKIVFKTKAGRKVLDGGGVEPDIKVTATEANALLQTLYAKNIFFDYANQYAYHNKAMPNPESFKLSKAAIDSFFNWVIEKEYTYKTKTEEALEKLQATAQKEKYADALAESLKAMQEKLTHNKLQDLQLNQADIIRFLQLEIVKRYYNTKGKYANSVANDVEVQEAINVLSNKQQYTNILAH